MRARSTKAAAVSLLQCEHVRMLHATKNKRRACLPVLPSKAYRGGFDSSCPPRTINNNRSPPLKDFPRLKCSPHQCRPAAPSLACSAVVSYRAFLCDGGGFPATDTVSRLGMGIRPLGSVPSNVWEWSAVRARDRLTHARCTQTSFFVRPSNAGEVCGAGPAKLISEFSGI